MCVAGSSEVSSFVFMCWVLLIAVRLVAAVGKLACNTCAALPTVVEVACPKGPLFSAVFSKRFGCAVSRKRLEIFDIISSWNLLACSGTLSNSMN
jgi:hypothetical protein